ncbi:MAG: CHAD domain-containing protein [Verrucomicrobiota bacterium]|jgi:CHAD domain-containing protein
MSYRIEKGEGLAQAFGRIAAEEMDLAMTQLGRRHRGEAVHNARKALKRLRALLRSLRVAFPKKLFRAENQRLAAAGRKISPLRDLHVQLRMLERLRGAPGPARARLQRQLLRRQSSFIRRIPALRKTVREMLRVSRQSIASWPLRHATAADLAAGLQRIYKQGRTAFKTARRNPTAQNLHEWRKKAKLLGYGFELIQGLGPGKFSGTIRCANRLTDALGDDHDLFMVSQALRREHRSLPARDFRPLAKRISARRAKLQKHAFKLAARLYREKPGPFGERLDRCLRRAGKNDSKS